MEEGGESSGAARVERAEGDLESGVERGFAVVEEAEGVRGGVVEGVNLALEGFGFVVEVLLEGGEVVGELLPEEGAAGHERGLALELVEARLSQLAQLAWIGDGPHRRERTQRGEHRKPYLARSLTRWLQSINVKERKNETEGE